ncbi:MAG: Methyltransferase protein [Edaphobacter sp.]|nr:Methyltransferase protein [Edaphobacter sp.]
MARVRKSTLSFDAITLEGSLLSSAKFAAVAERKAEEQTDADYSIPKGLTLRDETARYFRIGQALFRDLHASNTPARHKTIEFTEQLLRVVFGFSDIQAVKTPKFRNDRRFPVTLEALGGRVPVVVVPPSDGLDHASNSLSQDRRRSAASALQDWLNADEGAVWGLCTNGESLRLLRDNESLTRPAYLEADLRQIFEAEDYAGFSALWLVLHVSRFGRLGALPVDSPLERWRESGSKEGLAARDRLRDGVEAALLALGTGFLTNPANTELSLRLREGTWPIDEYFRQLLRLVYKLIFLLAAEDRNLLHIPNASEEQRKLYAQGYSLGALRDRAIRRSGWDNFHDRWSGLRVTFGALANGEPRLGLPALGGIFAASATPKLDRIHISNRFLMEAIFRLAWLRDEGLLMPVNWRDMETEELGSVYESLLELTPRLSSDGREFKFAEGAQTKGNARKTSGSYYTPDSLVQVLLDSALDPVLDRIESESEDPVRGLLGVTVIDPACGSGHFLLAAARRVAKRVVRIRHGDIHTEQQRLAALRDVVRSCIHGVDRNPMAVELTKVALWIETVEPGKPLGFLDANIRLGDSLLGIFTIDVLSKGIPDAAYKPLIGDDKTVAKDFSKKNRDEIKGQIRMRLSGTSDTLALPKLAQSLRAVRQLPEDTVAEINAKRERFDSASHDPRLQNIAQAADLYIAAFLSLKTQETARHEDNSLIPTTADVHTAMSAGTVYGPRLGTARELASTARAFHWALEFPDILASGGFDAVLGNPPWEVMQLGEEEYFAKRAPEIAEMSGAARKKAIAALRETQPAVFAAFEVEKRRFEAGNEFVRGSGRFELTAKGKTNTYALFAELFLNLGGAKGHSGGIFPRGIVTDAGTAAFFSHMVNRERLTEVFSFENEEFIFPAVHHAFQFCLFITAPTNNSTTDFAFFMRRVEQLDEQERHFRFSGSQVALINPRTQTSPVFRSKADALLTEKIYERVPILIRESSGKDVWKFRFRQGLFNMTTDSELFGSRAEFEKASNAEVSGNQWIIYESLIEGDDSPGYHLPLYEAKLIHQFDHRWATYEDDESRDLTVQEKSDSSLEINPRYWVHERTVQAAASAGGYQFGWFLGFRDITNATNERTIVACALPATAVGHNLSLILLEDTVSAPLAAALLGTLCSLICDYVARQKIGGTHLTFFIMEQLPVLPPSYFDQTALDFLVPRVLELTYTSHSMSPFAHDLGYDGPPFAWDDVLRATLRAEIDAWYAHAYGLTLDELRYILDPADVMGADYPSETFRVFKEKELKLHKEYRTRRLVLDAWDRMERGELSCPQPYVAPPQSAVQSMTIGQRNLSDQNFLLGAGPLFEGIESTSVEHSPFADPSTLPNDVWAMPNYNSISVQLQLAAILKQLSGPTSAARVRLAALYALNPQLITSRLSGTDLKTWQRLIGSSARASGAANVIQFIPRGNIEWRDAYTQLRGMHALLEDATNDTWAPGSIVQDFLTEGWADGRAGFVMKAMEGMEIETSIAELPVDLQTWVRAHAA